MLDKAQSERFLSRLESVLAEELKDSTDQRFQILISGLESLLKDRTPDQITDEMIEGQWDVATQLHPSDGSLRY